MAAVIGASSAWATIIPAGLAIDFRTWTGANDQPSWTVGGVTATAYPSGNRLYQDSVDGIGVRSGEVDEIDHDERIRVDFTGTTGDDLTGFWATDLFRTPDGGADHEEGILTLWLAGGSTQVFNFNGGASDQENGELWVSFGGPLDVVRARFVSVNEANDEYSVAGFTRGPPITQHTASVPDGGMTLTMLGLGLVGIWRFSRRSV